MQRQEQLCHLDEQCSQVQEGSISERNSFKNIATTKLTKQENDFKLPESLALGKNLLLQNNTQSEFDSDSNNSELSFEERLHFDYGNILSQKLRNYFEAKGLLEKTEVFDWNHQKKSFEVMREIQERSIEQIQRKWGNQQVQKIKYVIKFLKRQQDLAKIYFSVMKVLTLPLVTSGYFLLKQTLAFYLTGRQYFKTQSANVDPVSIRRYAFENYLKVCEQIMNDQKLSQIHYVEHNEYLKSMFEELIFSWLQGFFMCKEGYGRDKIDNRKKTLSGRLRAIEQSEVIQKHKKIKKS